VTTIRVHHDIGDLADDMASIVRRVRPDMRGVVKDGIRVGRDLARANAKRTAGAHGKHYPKAITAEMTSGLGLFGNTISGEYGPDPALPQGGMSFEHGSRNQPPHNDLAKSADVVGPSFLRSVDDQVGEWFW
jgi:hypothetical protein